MAYEGPRSHRPLIIGRRGAVASNHPLATQAGLHDPRGHGGGDEGRDRAEEDDQSKEDGKASRRDLLALPPLATPPAPVRRVQRSAAVPLAVPIRGHQA